jgi:hypothetical protein
MTARTAERFWLALYGMEKTTAATREAFIEQVKARVARIRT